jgi:hypothetical protein
MEENKQMINTNNFTNDGTRICEAAGKLIMKDMISKGVNVEEFKEALQSSVGMRTREDITTSNSSALYITALASVIRAAVEPNMVGLELLQLNTDLMHGGGKGAIQLPKEQRVVAAEVGEGGSISYTGTGYTSITVTPTKKIAASKITWEMVKRGMVSMITAEAARLGKALARKVDSDIIAGIEAIVTAGNSNRKATGGATTRVSYSNLIDARSYIESFEVGGFKATHLIVHPTDYAALCKDTDFKEALFRAPLVSGTQGSQGAAIFPQIEFFGPQKVIQTAQVTSGTTLFVDATELGTFVQETDVEVVDGRLGGTVDTEVIAVQSYGIGIQNVRAASGVIMAAS